MSAVRSTTRGIAALGLVCLALASCGGGSSSSTSILGLSLVDAPVTGATKVWVQFVGVEIKPVGGVAQSFDFSPAKGFDLLTLQNGNAATLLGDTTVPAGDYEWIRLKVDPTAGSSYVIDGTGQHSLTIPSGAQTGLKLIKGFTMPAGGRADFTVDFVLDQSIIAPPGHSPDYMMKPVLRMTNNVEVGTLEGTFDPVALNTITACASNPPRVYLYEGASVVPDDIYNPLDNSMDTAPDVAPLVTATAALNSSSVYAYHIGYVRTGTYTAAFTCDLDDPLVDENAPPAIPLNFKVYPQPVVINAGQTTIANF